jgi:hypothetical protein
MHLHSITDTCSTKDNGVERHNQSVSNFDEKASDNPDIPLGVTIWLTVKKYPYLN